MAFVTPVVEHWLEREIAQWVVLSESLNTYLPTAVLTNGRRPLGFQLLWAIDIPLPLKGCMGPCSWWAPRLQSSQPYG